MYNLDILNGYFQESSIQLLVEIFDKANKSEPEDTSKELQLKLSSILQKEASSVFSPLFRRATSPDGNHHIVVIENLCLLINIWGINVLFENWLFFDGELDVMNFHWNEKDNLVVFDVHFIIHNDVQKCICHFARDDFFVYFSDHQTSATDQRNWSFLS